MDGGARRRAAGAAAPEWEEEVTAD